MNASDVLRMLRSAGVTLALDATTGRLKYRAPRGAFTPVLRATLREYLPEIVHLFNERAAIMEYDGGLPRVEAEARAAAVVIGAGPDSRFFCGPHLIAPVMRHRGQTLTNETQQRRPLYEAEYP